MHGWLIIDKPESVTSASVVKHLKSYLPKGIKVGHAGTLDPFASGVLLIAIGEATKLTFYAMQKQKEYTFQVKWGMEKDTDDLTGVTTKQSDIIPAHAEIKNIILEFIGEISQIPPQYSAIKVNGKRAYKLSREKKQFTLKERYMYFNA